LKGSQGIHIVIDQLHLIPTTRDLTTHCHGSFAKMEEMMKLHYKTLISQQILMNSLPNTLVSCFSLQFVVISL